MFKVLAGLGLVTWLTLVVISACAWVTHVIFCIKASMWALLFIGAIIAPIGVIHGIGIWLGAFQ